MSLEPRATADDPVFAAIDGADANLGPLDRLIERTAVDPGAPFAPETLECLADLKREDRPAFETFRAQLKRAGCRVAALDEAMTPAGGEGEGRGPKQSDVLIKLAATADLFHAADGVGFADLDVHGHRETWPIRNKGFRRWFARRFFGETGGALSSEAPIQAHDGVGDVFVLFPVEAPVCAT